MKGLNRGGTQIDLLAALKDVKARLQERPSKNYSERIALLECMNWCEAGGEPVAGYTLDHKDLDTLIAALSGKEKG